MFESISDMANFSENYLPDLFEAYNKEDGNKYKYNVSNSVDPVTGKWRLVTGGSGDLSNYYNKTETDNLLAEKVDEDTYTEKIEQLEGDSTVDGSMRKLDAQVYQDSKDYTDERVQALQKKKSIACDEMPVYNQGTTPAEDTITYIVDGESTTIPADEIWFYYMAENDINGDGIIGLNETGLCQTIWI